jgi:hypothetical protein
MNVTYPISILSLLSIDSVKAPALPSVLETVVMETFFSLRYPVDLGLSSVVYRFLNDYSIKTNLSLDPAISIFQLSYMKHFEQPLAIYTPEHTARTFDDLPSSSHKLLLARLLAHRTSAERDTLWQECPLSSSDLYSYLQTIRQDILTRSSRMSLGIHTLDRLRKFLASQGSLTKRHTPWLSTISAVVEGDWAAHFFELVKPIKVLSSSDLSALGTSLHQLYNQTPAGLHDEQFNAARALAVRMINNESAGGARAVLREVVDELQEYLRSFISCLYPLHFH